jgi:hypothetical protein
MLLPEIELVQVKLWLLPYPSYKDLEEIKFLEITIFVNI